VPMIVVTVYVVTVVTVHVVIVCVHA
jgi:hypothetical protein